MTVQILVFLGTVVMAAASLAGGVWVAKIGGRSTQQARTTPAYAELLEEVKGYREEAKTDRAVIAQVETDLDAERKLRRELGDKVRDQDGQLQTLRRELGEERAERQKLQERVEWFKVTIGDAEDYIRRSWANLRRDYPHAWGKVFTPVPSFMTDPGFPAVPSPPDPEP